MTMRMIQPAPDFRLADRILLQALEEDMPMGDITTDSLIDPASTSKARFLAKEKGILAGLPVAARVFELLDPSVSFHSLTADGKAIEPGEVLAIVEGSSRILLKGERTALNLLQRLSGIATLTRAFTDQVAGTKAVVTDTRKTTPGMRCLEKYAVRAGGGSNHRFCLSDGVLIKDNHIRAAGGILPAVSAARTRIPHTIRIEVETASLEQVEEALTAGADIIMLDNMPVSLMSEAVRRIGGRARVEASGNVSLENIASIARTGVDLISVGRLTHSAPSLDISMKFV